MKAKTLLIAATLMAGFSLPTAAEAQPPEPKHDSAQAGWLVDALDTDGDGALSLDEFKLPPRAMGRFKGADADQNGELTLDEITREISASAERKRERAMAMFAAADSDGDGVLTAFEQKMSAFSRMDSNGDGVLTEAELREAHQSRAQRRAMQR